MKLNKLFLVFFLATTTVFAQDINTTEVKVEEGFKPTIPEPSRLNENAVFADTVKKDRIQNYKVIDVELKSDFKTKPLKAAIVKEDKIPKLYGTQVRIGFGNAWSTKASIIHNSTRSKTLSYGIIANHFANKYEVTSSDVSYLVKNSRNTMRLYGKKIKMSHILIANLDYDRSTAVYYLPSSIFPDENDFRNRFAYTKLSFSAISKELSLDKLKHNTTFFISDLNERSENQIHLSTVLSKTIHGYPFNLECELNNYLNYNNPDSRFESTSVQSFHLFPSTSATKYGIDFDLGLELHYLSDGTPFEFFPQIKASKELVKDILLIYGGLRHREQRHTFKSLSDENPYIHSFGMNQSVLGENSIQQNLQTIDTDELYITMRNVLGINEVFKGSIAYGTVQNFAHFVSITNENYTRFKVEYLDVKQLHTNATYNKEVNNIISLNINANYYKWDKEVYYKPNFICTVSVPINLRNKIKIIPSSTYIDTRASINYFASESELPFNTSLSKELSPQFHLNLDLYYFYSKQFSSYLQLNNLSNSKQDIWSGYREIGFNCIFGLNYSF